MVAGTFAKENATTRLRRSQKAEARTVAGVVMFANTGVVFSFSVDDVREAQNFYEQKLGLKTTLESEDEDYAVLWLHLAGDSDVLVYPKPDHIPASFTLLNFVVEDIDDVVDQLSSRGVRFLRYDQFGADNKGIVRGPGRDMAWFSDPAGNSHSVARPKTPSLLDQSSSHS